ncbi:30S ribosomal protein S6 [Bryobacter aggregatus]|uniref:30S ribosomal protein S6 n=1 Tax=Bryobacter aggregatus TaxID=360054 RepID=UPI0009B5C7EE|nr:30S ribosomal protein S6 [Bryobacter aggregatus]
MSLRLYEELFIVKPDSTDELVDPIIEAMTALIEKDGGKVQSAEKWGTRKLAYQVGRYREGYYILLKFEASGVTIKEIERRLRVNDLVIKYLTVRLDEEMKWVEKRKKRREKRAARKPQVVAMPAAPAAAPAAPQLPSEPSAPAPGKPTDGAPAPAAPVAPVVETPAAEATPAPAAE